MLLLTWLSASSQTITGTGTVNFLPKFNGTQSINNSVISQGSGNDANRVSVGGPVIIGDACTQTAFANLHVFRSIFIPSCSGGTTIAPNLMAVQGQTGSILNPTTLDYFRILGDGKVGIGLASPATQLDVQAIGSNAPFQVRNNAGATLLRVNTAGVGIGRTTTFAALDVQSISGNSPFIARNSAGSPIFVVSSISNRVGVGTDLPVAQLEIYTQGSNAPFQVSNSLGQQLLRIATNGRVSVGTNASPTAQLDVRPDAGVTPFQINTSAGVPFFTALANGKVQIGATAPSGTFASYLLGVDGDIVAKKVIVQTSTWADNVFDKDYPLKPLAEVETFVETNKHLPEIPSEREVIEKGIDVGDMNKLLLQKIEELTLYVIAQQKQINELIKKN